MGKISAPFVKDTGVIIEKFVEAVKDLFQYCYTEKELYEDIHKMSEEELFANLSEYLEDIKLGIFDALSQNLDKLSLKFLQICDKQEKFDKYLKSLKEKWRKSSAMKPVNRHDNKILKSTKQFINKLADSEASKSKSPNKLKSRIQPQVHTSENPAVNQYNSRMSISKPSHAQSVSSINDMPLNESKVGNMSVSSRATFTPKKPATSIRGSQLDSPGKSPARRNGRSPSPRIKASSPIKESSLEKSPRKKTAVDRSPAKFQVEAPSQLIVTRSNHGSFAREIIDPLINRKIILI